MLLVMFSHMRVYINMDDLIESLEDETGLIITAPPGWGKTYKLLEALKKTRRKAVFVFPLRALCDEVYLQAVKKNMNVCNIRKQLDLDILKEDYFDLVLVTPECLNLKVIEQLSHDYVFIFDEFHLFFYWGDSFRTRMQEILIEVFSHSPACLFLSATMNQELLNRSKDLLELNFESIYHVNFGNQKLKNIPNKIYYYPRPCQNWMLDEIELNRTQGVKLVFCAYRNQVKALEKKWKERGLNVLSCVGGEAQDFILKLQDVESLDIIVATSVVSHGVNLPRICSLYFLYEVENLDFYLQMVGRGGRDGSHFELHTLNKDYFNKRVVYLSFLCVCLKRIRNKLKSFLYYSYAN